MRVALLATRRAGFIWPAIQCEPPQVSVKRKTIYGKTRAEVAEKLTKAMADRDSRFVFDAKNQTVREYLQGWLNESVRGSVKPLTFESRERIVRNYLVPALGHKIKVLTPVHI